MAQFNAASSKTELYAKFEALRVELRAFSGRVSATNQHFDETEFDKHSSECLDALREDLEHILDDADEKLAEAEYADGLEPGQSYTPSYRPLFPYPAAE
jgi:hypothetical protein